jgi:hypothetical protein
MPYSFRDAKLLSTERDHHRTEEGGSRATTRSWTTGGTSYSVAPKRLNTSMTMLVSTDPVLAALLVMAG